MIKRFLVFFVFMLTLSLPSFSATIDLTGIIRDFNDTHPDFEDGGGVDPGIVMPQLGLDKKPVYAGQAGNPTTHGKEYFDQWYRDVAGVNMSMPFTITLDNTITPDPSVYSFRSNSFFPIDNKLFGNQGRNHNFHFTYELHSRFTYQGGEVFSFEGDDDIWVFINNQLVVDLGGVHPAMSASVNLDDIATSIGITLGNDYDFDLFFAERHTIGSHFNIDTSIVLRNNPNNNVVPEPASVVLFGFGLLGIGVKRKRV